MQISLTNKGIFVLVVGGVTLLLVLLSDNGRTGYEVSPDVISLRTIFVTMVTAVEEAGGVIKAIYGHKSLNLHRKPALLKLDRSGNLTGEEIITEADLVSNYVIARRIKLLRPDLISQVNSEEHEMPQQSSVALATRHIFRKDQFMKRQEKLLSLLPEQDIFLHLRQVSFWIDPLDATQEFSENLLKFVSVMGCAAIHGEPMFGVVHFPFSNTTYWSSLGTQLSENLRNTLEIRPAQNCLRILISRSHSTKGFSEKVRKTFGSTPIEIIPVGGSGYKMIELARGLADLYVHAGGARRWDVCAASAILHARGGVVRTLTGATITFNHRDSIDLDPRKGIFAAASRKLFDTWAPTVSALLNDS